MDPSEKTAGAGVLSVRDGSGKLLHELSGNFASIDEGSSIESNRLVGVLQAPLPSKFPKDLVELAGAPLDGARLHGFTPHLPFPSFGLPFDPHIEEGDPLIGGVRIPKSVPHSHEFP